MMTIKKDLHVILCRTDGIGDVVLSLPIAGIIKENCPFGWVTFIGRSYTKPVIDCCKAVDEFYDFDELNDKIIASWQADAAILLFPDRRLAKMLSLAHVPVRIGTSHRWYNWIYCTVKVPFSRRNSDLHEAQLNTKLLAPIGLDADFTKEGLSTFYHFERPFVQFPLLDYVKSSSLYTLIMHPKSKGSAREWPLTRYYELALQLADYSIQVIITGTEAESQLIKDDCPQLLSLPNVIDATGKLNLIELIALISSADGLIACSTGPLHIAAMCDIYAIGLYPAKRPMHPGRWAPLGQQAEYLVLDKNCKSCPESTACACLASISVQEVKAHILGNMTSKRKR